MKFLLRKLFLPLLVVTSLSGCGGPLIQSEPNPLNFTSASFPAGQYSARFDNVQFLLDTSQSMDNDGQEKLQSAKSFLNSINLSLPDDFSANTGLRTFGHSLKQCENNTGLVYGMSQYSRDVMANGLEKVRFAWGDRPLASAINAAAADLEDFSGTSALVIVSDGSWNWHDAPDAVREVKTRMGDNLCVYTVWVGDVVGTHKMLEKVAMAGGCGFAENGAVLTDQKALATYVEKVLLTRKPAPLVVEEPPKAVAFNLFFGFDLSAIVDKMVGALVQAKDYLIENPSKDFVISGHADETGSEAYNQGLSERRAASVTNWLTGNGINADRLESAGYGETQPREDNSTLEGRRLNRRVEIRTE